jgi:hypothetical protein
LRFKHKGLVELSSCSSRVEDIEVSFVLIFIKVEIFFGSFVFGAHKDVLGHMHNSLKRYTRSHTCVLFGELFVLPLEVLFFE